MKGQDQEFLMTAKLPDELRTVVSAHPGETLELIDEQTRAAYVLVPADEFQRLKLAAEDELGDTYAAQVESAMQAGWDDPRMDEYNDYDAHRRQP
jgi:bifunctional DNA-binding transcriptional regulator/antitoxin component of YhaV-PrlF toxin-antitoxin module